MARFYADENFPQPVVELLRDLGHDVLTVIEVGQAGQAISDEAVLNFATSSKRAVLTLNRRDFIRLHSLQPDHTGIIVCTEDLDRERQAARIHEAVSLVATLKGRLIRVNRP